MRISGGDARGVTLVVPAGDAVRPATDGLRQAVFSSLALRTSGARVIDLFAGSGSYGLEALSRGAAHVRFIERHAKTAGFIQRNLESVAKSLGRNARDLAQVMVGDALTWAPATGDPPPDLLFIDPPYDQIEALSSSLFLRLTPWVRDVQDPLVLFEAPGEVTLSSPGWTPVKRLGGKAPRQPGITVFRRIDTPSDPARP